jgi:Zn-dependent protease
MNLELVFLIIALVIVITVHEFSHAWVANYFGDPTARLAGRVSLNPLKHLDPVGTIMLFLVHIGWGKPVPVNPGYFRKPKRDNALTALAGPASNLILALILALPLKYFYAFIPAKLGLFLATVLDVSILLFAFNMLPFPPLDGSKIIGMVIPRKYELAYERYLHSGVTYFVVFMLFDQFVVAKVLGFSILSQFMGIIYTFIKSIIFLGT